jgi:hypothetical protein
MSLQFYEHGKTFQSVTEHDLEERNKPVSAREGEIEKISCISCASEKKLPVESIKRHGPGALCDNTVCVIKYFALLYMQLRIRQTLKRHPTGTHWSTNYAKISTDIWPIRQHNYNANGLLQCLSDGVDYCKKWIEMDWHVAAAIAHSYPLSTIELFEVIKA